MAGILLGGGDRDYGGCESRKAMSFAENFARTRITQELSR